MRFGIFNLMNQWNISQEEVFDGTLACTKLADEIGFDVAWFAEHHFSNYCLSPSPLMMAAAAARETRRIALGPAVIVAPLYNPIRLAEEIALLDQLSHGRVVLGIGSGYQRFEFDAFGADLSERQDRMLEIWRIIDQAVHENRFEFSGKHYHLPDVPQAIHLYRKRTLETFYVSWSPEMIRHAVACDAVPFCTVGWGSSEVLRDFKRNVEKQYRQAGFELAGRKFAAQRYVFVTDDEDELRRVAEGIRYAGRCAGHMRVGAQVLDGSVIADRPVQGEPTLEAIQAALPIGSAEVVAQRIIDEIRMIGISDLSCFVWPAGMGVRSVLRSMERLGAEVLPVVRKAIEAEASHPSKLVA